MTRFSARAIRSCLLTSLPLWMSCLGLADPQSTSGAAGATKETSPDAAAAMSRLKVSPGLKLSLWAGEPLVQNITSFCFDSLGRAYVVETGRRRTSVFDIRNFKDWVEDDLALRSVEQREQFLSGMLATNRAFLAAAAPARPGAFTDFNRDGVIDGRDLEVESERIRLVWDGSNAGHADRSIVFADGFKTRVSGVAAGVLAQGNQIWFTCIPDLWRMPAADAKSPVASAPTARERLLHGFGVHVAFGGHDLHGLIKGPDGRIYFSIADRGTSVTNREGRAIQLPDSGAIFRCEPDGTKFDLYARGLRNPQELCFDDAGNLWTGDNNGDGGDKARWTLVLEGADYGWTIGWQWLPKMGAWNSERLWHTRESNSAAYLVPPVAHVGHGPAGIAHYPGTGLPARYDRHFFMADFPGGVRTFTVEPDGAFFRVAQDAASGDSWKWLEDNSAANRTGKLLWDLSPVDVAFPPGGGVVVADWVEGWEKTGKGRLWKISDPALDHDPLIAETAKLLAEGMTARTGSALIALLGHRDQRVRLEAQWELASRGGKAVDALIDLAEAEGPSLPRWHALWALEQIHRNSKPPETLIRLLGLLDETDPELRTQAALFFGRLRFGNATPVLAGMLSDPSLRVRAAAVEALSAFMGDYYSHSERPALVAKLKDSVRRRMQLDGRPGNAHRDDTWRLIPPDMGNDPVLHHALVRQIERHCRMANSPTMQATQLREFSKNPSAPLRLAAVVAGRKLGSLGLVPFLKDRDPQIALEAVRAIHDAPVDKAMLEVARLATDGVESLPSQREPWPQGLHFTRDEWTTWILRRAVNAALRLGNDSDAAALATLASRTNAPESVRVEAIEALGEWGAPSRRDKIVGLIRPIAPRDPAPARVALARRMDSFLSDPSSSVVMAAVQAGSALRLDGLAPRLESLRTHSSPLVRAEAARLLAASRPVVIAERIAVLRQGGVADRQSALADLGASSDPQARAVLGEWVQRLLAGQVEPALQLDVIEAARAAKLSLTAWTNTLSKSDPFAALRPALQGGNALRGRKVFVERQDLACFRCHKLKGEGGDVGPELAGIGKTRGREYVLESILQPNAQIAQGFENVVLTRKGGSEVSGMLKSETATELVVQTAEDGLVKVLKSDVMTRQRGPSSMPEGLGDLISPLDLRDLIEALSE